MSPEVKAIYERALGKVEDKLPSSQQSKNLPKTEDIYRQSAPDDMKHLPSDESIYRPSQPLIDPGKSAIEPESAFGASQVCLQHRLGVHPGRSGIHHPAVPALIGKQNGEIGLL